MAVLDISDDQVLELIRQLPQGARGEALRKLLADPNWDALLAYGQERLDHQFTERGWDRSQMTPDQIEAAIERIADGG